MNVDVFLQILEELRHNVVCLVAHLSGGQKDRTLSREGRLTHRPLIRSKHEIVTGPKL